MCELRVSCYGFFKIIFIFLIAVTLQTIKTDEGERWLDLFYFSNLNFDVAIKPSPIMPIVILVGNGRIPKNIKTAPVKARIIPVVN